MKKDNNQRVSRTLVCGALFSSLCMIAFVLCVFLSLFADGERGEDITVPSFVGESIDSVELPEGFDVKKVFVFSESYPEGIILSQHPAAGEVRRRRADGSFGVLSITVSLGRDGVNAVDAVGEDAELMSARLCAEGVMVRLVSVYSDEVPQGRVVSVAGNGETSLSRGDRITLFVSRGPAPQRDY